jgi:hypothetical protein
MDQRDGSDTPTQGAPPEQLPPFGAAPGFYQAPPTPAAPKGRSKLRTPAYVVIALGIGIAIGNAGSSSSKTTPAAAAGAPTATAPTGATTTSAPKASAPAKAVPAHTMALTVSGHGEKSTRSFTTSANWALTYTFNCSSLGFAGNMIVTEQGGSQDGLPIVNDDSIKGGDTTYEHDDAGQHSLSIDSECAWTIKVLNNED